MTDEYPYQLIRLNALKNAIYHSARQRMLGAWNRRFNFLVVVLGATAASDILMKYGVDQRWLALATAVIGAAQLVFDFGGRAGRHQILQRDYFMLSSEIEANPSATVAECAKWQTEALRIAADEPPVYHALDAKAYNQAISSLGNFDVSKEVLVLPLLHRIGANWIHFGGYTYPKRCELVATVK